MRRQQVCERAVGSVKGKTPHQRSKYENERRLPEYLRQAAILSILVF